MTPTPPRRIALLALLVHPLLGCPGPAPSASDPAREPARPERPPEDPGANGASPPGNVGNRPASEGKGTPISSRADDGAPSDQMKDLAAMCAALDHDYVDGTLSDYYAEVEPSTTWGARAKKDGDAADQPGRHLEATVNALANASSLEIPEPCVRLFDYLDDVE